MDIWETLGIEETDDLAAVKAAYLALLPSHNPEDDPEGFKVLRSAYEAAQNFIRDGKDSNPYSDIDKNTPRGRVMARINELCGDYYARNFPENWLEILNGDDCSDLITQSGVLRDILRLLMDDIYLPQSVWQALDGFFGIKERHVELKEEFPPPFLRFARNCVDSEEILRAKFFKREDAPKLKELADLFGKLNRAVMEGDSDKARGIAKKLDSIDVDHPDTLIVELEMERGCDAPNQSRIDDIVSKLEGGFPDDCRAMFFIGKYYYETDRTEEAAPYLEAAHSADPSDFGARLLLAAVIDRNAGASAHEWERCKDLAGGCLAENQYNGLAHAVMQSVSEKLAGYYSRQGPFDIQTRYKLAACLYNTKRYKECEELIENAPHEIEDVGADLSAKYYELMLDIITGGDEELTPAQKEKALASAAGWEKAETRRSRLNRLPDCYVIMGDEKTAKEKAEALIKEMPGDPVLANTLFRILKKEGRAAEGLRIAENSFETADEDIHLIMSLAEHYCEEKEYYRSIEMISFGLRANPRFYGLRLLHMRVLYELKDAGALLAAARKAIEFGGPAPDLEMFLAAAEFMDAGTGDADTAKKTVSSLLLLQKECFETTILYATLADAAAAASDYDMAVYALTKLIDDGARPNPYYYVRRGMYRKNKDAAQSDFLTALKISPDYAFAHYRLGIFHEYNETDIDAARGCYKRAFESDPANHEYAKRYVRAVGAAGELEAAITVADKWLGVFGEGDEEGAREVNRAKLYALCQNDEYEEGARLLPLAADAENPAQDPETARLLGICFLRSGNRGDALKWLTVSLIGDSNESDTFMALFDLYMEECDGRKAVLAARDAVKASEGSIESHIALGEAIALYIRTTPQERSKKAELEKEAKASLLKARNMLKKMLKRGHSPAVCFFLSKAYSALGKWKAAKKYAALAGKK